MGPITLFDKSFLQSLSVDESVWFDHFFLTNICPIFYAETLADLGKAARDGKTPEQEVAIIASKFPEQHSSPNVHHSTLALANLFGKQIPSRRHIALAGGRPVKSRGKSGVVFDQSPEAEAFARWQSGAFHEIERRFASQWRAALRSIDLREAAASLAIIGIDGKCSRDLGHAHQVAVSFVDGSEKKYERMRYAFGILGIGPEYQRDIHERWSIAGYPPLRAFASYAAHVLTVEVFFRIALAAGLISTERPSNRLDIAYLFYLPFSMVFVSSDRLHERCAKVFLGSDQAFVFGNDLKEDLRRINKHYSELPEATKALGITRFAKGPPDGVATLTTLLWDQCLPGWREIKEAPMPMNPDKEALLASSMNEMKSAPALEDKEVDFDLSNPDGMMIQRMVHKRKGSWWQLPRDLKESEADD